MLKKIAYPIVLQSLTTFFILSAFSFVFAANSSKIEGYIYDGATYAPIQDAKVEVTAGNSVVSDNKGYFTITSPITMIRNRDNLLSHASSVQIHGTMLSIKVPGEKPVPLSIRAVDLSGRNVLLFKGKASIGSHRLNLANKIRASGVYQLNITLGDRNIRTKFSALNGTFFMGDMSNSSGTHRIAQKTASTATPLTVSKSGYATREVVLQKAPDSPIKIRLSATGNGGKYHHPAILHQEFTYSKADFSAIHASSIEDLPNGDLVSVYFGGPGESKPGTVIRFQRKPLGGEWSKPTVVGDDGTSAKTKYACWNPVIYQVPDGELLCWWKVGPRPWEWWGMLKRSSDNGHTWSEAEKVGGVSNPTLLGPVKNKPIKLKNGSILVGSSREDAGWVLHIERSTDNGKTFKFVTEIENKGSSGAIQPTILQHADGHLQILARDKDGKKMITSTSTDNGTTWTPTGSVKLPNNSCGLDAVTLKDGRHLVVYNHSIKSTNNPFGPSGAKKGRCILNVSVSKDGNVWDAVTILDSPKKNGGQFIYPAVIQSADGLVHISYTYHRRRVKHVVMNPDLITNTTTMPDAKWPSSGPASIAP